ncbi:MAG: tRNA epoxyqueuosine(34) reductase QueG [Bacillota bacterium]
MINKNIVKKKAKELGFDLVGFTTAEPFSEIKEILKRRKDKGELSSFISHDLDLLTNPKKHLKNAKSIISLAISYANSNKRNNKLNYSISNYTWGDDYHLVFNDRLNKLNKFLKNYNSSIKTKSYVDTGPILDRAIAERAGLGWIGKNNSLINKKFGSYIFLGEIITNIDFIPDKKVDNKCGNCRKCIEVCPGNALIEKNHINPKRCIGYLTQKKGIIPVEERKKIGNNLWGCDRCQEVCPYNKNIVTDLHEEFDIKLNEDLKTILTFSKKNIPENWEKSALSWRGSRILIRNALIIIANSKIKSYKKEVKKLFSHSSSVIRAYAYWTYSEISEEYINILKNQLNKEKTPEGKKELKNILYKR